MKDIAKTATIRLELEWKCTLDPTAISQLPFMLEPFHKDKTYPYLNPNRVITLQTHSLTKKREKQFEVSPFPYPYNIKSLFMKCKLQQESNVPRIKRDNLLNSVEGWLNRSHSIKLMRIKAAPGREAQGALPYILIDLLAEIVYLRYFLHYHWTPLPSPRIPLLPPSWKNIKIPLSYLDLLKRVSNWPRLWHIPGSQGTGIGKPGALYHQ